MEQTLTDTSPAIRHLMARDRRLAKVIRRIGPLTYDTDREPYAFLVHEIIEQMLSIRAGWTIYGRVEALCGGAVTPEAMARLTEDDLRAAGVSRRKASYLLGLTEAVRSGELDLSALPAMTDEEVKRTLTAFRGVGSWTAKMVLLFVLDRPDILPVEDAAFLQAWQWLYKSPDRSAAEVEKKCRKWRPYSSAAARYLYRARDLGFLREPFHLYK